MSIFSTLHRILTPKSWVASVFAWIATLSLLNFAKADPLISQIRYPSAEKQINGRFCTADQKLFPGARPLILFNHGGVDGVSLNNERRMLELCRLGYAVVASSYRGEDGSDGEIEVALGEVDDVLALLAHLQNRALIDSNRVALIGFSHGALISLQAAKRQVSAKAPAFRALVFAYGVADISAWYRYLQKTKQLGKDALTQRIYGKGPELSPDNFTSRLGILGLEKLPSDLPILIVQGQRDVIVPASQADILYEALKNLDIRVAIHRSKHGQHGYLIRREALVGAEKLDSERAWQAIYAFLEARLVPHG